MSVADSVRKCRKALSGHAIQSHDRMPTRMSINQQDGSTSTQFGSGTFAADRCRGAERMWVSVCGSIHE